MNDVCYLVERFDDALNYYQVEDIVSKQDFEYYYEGIKKHGKVRQIKSILATPDGYDSNYRQYHTSNEGKSGVNRNEIEHGRESSKMVRLDSNQTSGREQSTSDRSGDSQSSRDNIKNNLDSQQYERDKQTNLLIAETFTDITGRKRRVLKIPNGQYMVKDTTKYKYLNSVAEAISAENKNIIQRYARKIDSTVTWVKNRLAEDPDFLVKERKKGKASRELDTEYLNAVNRGDMAKLPGDWEINKKTAPCGVLFSLCIIS